MSDVRELYQKVLLDHYKNPRNVGRLEGANRLCDGHNPLCGDRITVYLRVTNDAIENASFEGSACAICMASASVMTETLKGKTFWEARTLSAEFRAIVSADSPGIADAARSGEFAAFAGVSEFPVRVKCATLPWRTMLAALENKGESVTTE